MSPPPIRLSVIVPLERQRAFDLFTRRIGEWWPLTSKSLAMSHAASCVLETGLGGRIYERTAEGVESIWGTITEWSEPERFVMSWHPGRHPSTTQVLEVRFVPLETGTRVELEHRGWAQVGDRGIVLRDRYESGWPEVLAPFEAMAKREGSQ